LFNQSKTKVVLFIKDRILREDHFIPECVTAIEQLAFITLELSCLAARARGWKNCPAAFQGVR
jgi:hypothetical protein